MPELPEVQAVVDYLESILPEKIIDSIESPNNYQKIFDNGSIKEYHNFLKEKQIISITRRGKYIIINLDSGFLLFHLRMTGRFITQITNNNDLKYISCKLKFSDGSELFFHDIRKFGRAYICQSLGWLEKRIGIEPLSDQMDPIWLHQQLQMRQRMVKALLLDQHMISGLGNIYVDESLWIAKIHPKTISSKISKMRSKVLCIAIKKVLKEAIKYKGTTIINFTFGLNETGTYKNKLQIFGKQDKPCPRCKLPIIKIFLGQRGTHYCKKCQRL